MFYIYKNSYKISKSTFKNVRLYYFFQSKINFFNCKGIRVVYLCICLLCVQTIF